MDFIIIFCLKINCRHHRDTEFAEWNQQKASIFWLQSNNRGILLPEGLSRFAFRRPCPVECLPNEMQRIFHRGEAYSSGVAN